MQSSTRSRGSKAKAWLTLIALCVAITLILGGLKFLQISDAIAFAKSFPERSETVTAITTEVSEWQTRFQTIGEVLAPLHIELRNEVDGTISAVGFAGGESVLEGQSLLELDSSEERAQLRAFNAQIQLAKVQLQRTQELRKNKLASKNDLDRARADLDVLVANSAALSARIKKKTLTAPFTASTGLHTLQIGQYLAANTLITELNGNNGRYWVDFKLPQEKAVVEVGAKVQVFGRGVTKEPLTAEIISAASQIDPRSRNRAYRARLLAPPASLRPGAVLTVDLALETISNVIRVPNTSVRRTNFGAYVYVLSDAEKGAAAPFRAERRQVTTTGGDEQFFIVSAGLQAGEMVAAEGAFKLSDGLLAHVKQNTANEREHAARSTEIKP